MAEGRDRLRRKVAEFPRGAGVYLMKDAAGQVVYVGKARNLRARVRSYFQAGRAELRLITERFDEVADIDVVVTATESEALILESNFIKQFRPKYNVVFRDDKSFVSISINPSARWPRATVTRKLGDAKALYFGPYASAKSARATVRLLQDMVPLRRCSLRECAQRSRPCSYGEMGKCVAPCTGDLSPEEYGRLVDEAVAFLRGGAVETIERLAAEMQVAAEAEDFERAAKLRDQVRALQRTIETQHVAASGDDVDRDVFGLCLRDRSVRVAVLFVRKGRVQDAASWRFPAGLAAAPELLSSFLGQFYASSRFIPREVLLPLQIDDAEVLAETLSARRGRRVRILHPKRGAKRHMVEMAVRNAEQAEDAAAVGEEKRAREMAALQELAGLGRLPRRIECFDISTTQGREAVGSMVVFQDGDPEKSSYRHYRIRSVEGQDDFAMMAEVLKRRYAEGDAPNGRTPNLILVDGGAGQLTAAERALAELDGGAFDLAALAKARRAGGRQLRRERLFLPGRADAVIIPDNSSALHLLVRVRDEAHRFAVSYHRKLRSKGMLASPLQEVDGVGRKLAARLLEHFGGLNKVQQATVDELADVPGVGVALAEAICDWGRADTH